MSYKHFVSPYFRNKRLIICNIWKYLKLMLVSLLNQLVRVKL